MIKRCLILLLPLAALLTSCGTIARSGQQRFQDGVYSQPVDEPEPIHIYSKEEIEAMAQKQHDLKKTATDTLHIVIDDPWSIRFGAPFFAHHWMYGYGFYRPWHSWNWGFYDPFFYDPWFYDPFWGPYWDPFFYDPWYSPWYGPGYWPGYRPYWPGYWPGSLDNHRGIHTHFGRSQDFVYRNRIGVQAARPQYGNSGRGTNYRFPATYGSAGSASFRSGNGGSIRVNPGNSGSGTVRYNYQRSTPVQQNSRSNDVEQRMNVRNNSYQNNSNFNNMRSSGSGFGGGGFGGGGFSGGGSRSGGSGSSGSRGGGGRR